jgi:predicted permease
LTVSQYENWRKYEVPIDCFEIDNQEQEIETEDLEEKTSKIKQIFTNPAVIVFIIALLVIGGAKIVHKPTEKIEIQETKELSVIEVLAERQQINIQKI